MAKCAMCGKGVVFGINISHSHRRTNRTWKANIKKVHMDIDGRNKKIPLCTSCLRTMSKENA